MANLSVLFVTSELHPLIKTGGLADVSQALPSAVAQLGVDVRILIPGYRPVLEQLDLSCVCAHLEPLPSTGPMRLLASRTHDSQPALYVLDCPTLFDRDGGPYADPLGIDWRDNHLRFGALSRVAALLSSSDSPLDWRPQVVHCNDWQSALTPAYLAFDDGEHAATLMSIHNLAFAGRFPPSVMPQLGLPPQCFGVDGVEFYGDLSFLKAGLFYADHIVTVSPRYAEEIQTESFGAGFHGLLAQRRERLTGILNGIDVALWSPERDPHISVHFNGANLAGKAANKRALQTRCNLASDANTPLIGMVTRLSHQKGIDLAASAIEQFVTRAQFVILGRGEPELETLLDGLRSRFPDRVSVTLDYDESLAHQIEAGADVFLMPSRYEPCGLNQMYSMRYGTLPVVRATGGLADSVVDATNNSIRQHRATGFVFGEATDTALSACLRRALDTYSDGVTWRSIQQNAMAQDFSWQRSATEYVDIYQRLASTLGKS